MTEKTLEKTIKSKLKPILDKATKDYLGFEIEKLNEDIIDKLEKPVLKFKIDTNIPFKKAKKIFKKEFIENLLKAHLGNISEVAKAAGLDRRSVHRVIKELDIDITHYRTELIHPDMYRLEKVDEAVKESLDDFKEIIVPDKLKGIYQSIMSNDEIKKIDLREPSLTEAEFDFEREYIETALKENNNSIKETAKKIKLRYETLIRKIKALRL